MHSRWPRLDGLAYGGDYNPEQWPEEVWAEDVALMREAGVTLVSVGIFSWGMLEPRPGEYEFGWLDRVLGLLDDARVAVDLGTPTAAPPPWFLRRHPEARPVTRDGLTLGGGSRQTYCPSSPAYARAATEITRQLAVRYGAHPAVVLWHVNNEYGPPLGECYCETSAAAFRDWLRERYGDLAAPATSIGAPPSGRSGTPSGMRSTRPRTSTSVVNPAQRLDFARFSSEALLACFKRERDILHDLSPGHPGHHQLHGQQLEEHGLLAVGAGGRRDLQRQLPDRRAHRLLPGSRHVRGPDQVAGQRRTVAADGALDQRRVLAAEERREAARRDAP